MSESAAGPRVVHSSAGYGWDAPQSDRFFCGNPRCHSTSTDQEDFTSCDHPKCPRDFRCEGCIYECRKCKGDFCKAHIVEVDCGDRFAEYECVGCLAK